MLCRICDSKNLTPFLDLGMQPWANHFLKEEEVGSESKYPLRLEYCQDCACVQLDYTVPKEVMFFDHTYVSGTTKTLADHFLNTAKYVDQSFFKPGQVKSVLDIGSNDGTQLQQYRTLGFETLGVESCRRVAEIALKHGVETRIEYFNEENARKIGRKYDVINASGVFFHLEELHSAARAVKLLLSDEGVFVVQFLYMKSIVENLAFDQVYHEHLLYYTLQTVEKLLSRHGLSSFDCYLSPIHGGSIVLFATHSGKRPKSERLIEMQEVENQAKSNDFSTYQDFALRVAKMRDDTLSYLREKKAAGKRIFGFGAPVKGNTFLNYCQIGKEFLDCLVEKNPMRKGLYSPGMHLPLVLEDELDQLPDIYFGLAWNFKAEILKNNQALIDKGVEFFFPVNPPQR